MCDTGLRMDIADLKREDPYAKEIIDSAPHVALYKFVENEWEKTTIEGSLFVYSRNGEPYHSLVIKNRLNTNNFIEPVSKGLDLQLKDSFLLYRNAECRIFGIWFHGKDECVRLSTKLSSLVKECLRAGPTESTSPQPAILPPSAPAAPGGVDIFSKARDDFNSNNDGMSKPELNQPK